MDGMRGFDGPELESSQLVDSKAAEVWNLEEALRRVAHWLPSQGPIKDFIHHNTLHAFQDRPFHDAIAFAGQLFGAYSYLPISWYQAAHRNGQITENALRRVAGASGNPVPGFEAWRRRMLESFANPSRPPGAAGGGMRARRMRAEEIDLDALVHPLLFRMLSSYLDQGVSIWRMPGGRNSFWEAMGNLIGETHLPLPPLTDPECRELLRLPCEQAIEICLKRIVGDEAFYESYLLEMCLAHAGWSGMVGVLETAPGGLLAPRPIRLREMIAVELVIELGWLIRRSGDKFTPASQFTNSPPVPNALAIAEAEAAYTKIQRMWHEAFEWSCYESALSLIEKQGGRAGNSPAEPRFQAFFCIDDRECSLRRHLEKIEPTIETFGIAGFFGVDFFFQPAVSAHAFQYCPVVLKPKHLVREVPSGEVKPRVPTLKDLLHFSPASNTLFRGWLLTQTVGVVSLVKLAASILWPGSKLLTDGSLSEVENIPTRLELLRAGDQRTAGGLLAGYSIEEMADRVQAAFVSTGAGFKLSKLVVFVAHGSSSANNPHFAAYHCGACSGKAGSPNARAFSWMANHPEVRRSLAGRGMVIPAETYVLGAIHDTARDEVTYLDLEGLPESHRALFEEFRSKVELALSSNAVERCQRFELAPPHPSPAAARKHVADRTVSIFEPRPELNHANNVLCIVGRRQLTRGLFFDRRAFMNSYDPTEDASGKILEGILAAVVPVCGGINLEYYFSRVDNMVYGAGSKLPHNVVSLLGVANGVEGDLLTGLPSQMIEVHDPIRLLLIVEQEPALVLDVIKRRPGIYEWIGNDWMKLACFSPTEKRTYFFDAGKMVPLEGLPDQVPGPFTTAENAVVS